MTRLTYEAHGEVAVVEHSDDYLTAPQVVELLRALLIAATWTDATITDMLRLPEDV